MSQGTQGLDIQNVSGANYRQYVNEALKQVATMSSGDTAPSNPQQQQLWFDTDDSRVKIYLGTTWSPFLLLPGSSKTALGSNTALGVAALQANTTGIYNTALGRDALSQNTTETHNTAVGSLALSSATGSFNTALGGAALYNNTTGSYNTALGGAALYFNNTGENNIAIGANTLYNNTTGVNNTAIGANAGRAGHGVNITTQHNHFILGNSSVTDLICADTSISGHSDARDKKDIEALNFSGLAYINALIPRKFTWDMRKCVGIKKDITEIGFIAQEVESVQSSVYAVPGVVSIYDIDYTDPETNEHFVTDQKLVAPARFIPILVKAIQELTVRVELLETALQAQ
jgi:hypothetical protein